jgi:2-keto-3-deoxy-6-phosphogluconate aldolase
MALTHWGFIYTGAGNDPARTRVVTGSASCRLVAVGVERPEQGIEVARALVAEGVQLIELCGGFGPVWAGKIVEAIGRAVPVGAVGYGPEAIDQLHGIFGS